MEVVRAFLRGIMVERKARRASAVGGDNQRLISGAGDTLSRAAYHRTRLGIYRFVLCISNGALLGDELINIGEARYLGSEGDIARIEVLSAYQERNNDILPLEIVS